MKTHFLLEFELSAHWFHGSWADNSNTKSARVFILAYDAHFDSWAHLWGFIKLSCTVQELRAVYTTWFCQDDFVIHYKSCNVNTTMTPYYTVMHDFGIMHDKSWGIGLVLFAMTKSCHFSQSACRSLRLMSFQEKTGARLHIFHS